MTAFANSDVPSVRAYAQINNQAQPWIPLETFDVQLTAYGSVGRFSCTTAISALAGFGWGPGNLLAEEIRNAQPALSDGSPTYPIKLYATAPYNPTSVPPLIFAGDIDELEWDFDNDQLTITGRDYGGRMKDWVASLTPAWMNMNYVAVAKKIIMGVGLTPRIATSSTVNESLRQLLGNIGQLNTPGTQSLGYTPSGSLTSTSMWTAPVNMWDLLNEVARGIGFIVTVHTDGTVYVGPPGGDSEVNPTPRTFTWFASPGTSNVVPVRHLEVTHGARQYGNFAVRGFGFHPPSVSVSNTEVYFTSGSKASFTAAGIGRQSLTAGVYRGAAGAAGFAPGKPNYFFYFPGKTQPQIQADAIGLAFDIAKYLYVVHGEIDGDPTLVPTTPLTLAEAPYHGAPQAGDPGHLQGYAQQQLNVSGVNHTFNMTDGFLTKFTAWYAPSAQSLPAEPGEMAVQVTS